MGIKLHNSGELDHLDQEFPEGPTYDVELDGHLLELVEAVGDILDKNIGMLVRVKAEIEALRGSRKSPSTSLLVDAQIELLESLNREITVVGERKRQDAAMSRSRHEPDR